MGHIQEAFDQAIADAKVAEGWYVCLMIRSQRYVSPAEGGTWATDNELVKYKYFPTEEQAQAAKESVEKLAKELTLQAKAEHGRHCLREMDWCDRRGLDYDYLGEVDGPDEYYVLVSEGIPTNSYGPTHYE